MGITSKDTGRRIKVCLVIDRLDLAGGPRYFELLARGLETGSYSVTLASDPSSPLWDTLTADGLALAAVPFSRPFSTETLFSLKRLFTENAFDIVHSMGLRADLHTRLAAVMCRPRPIIVSTVAMLARGFDVGRLRRLAYEWAER
ncbi:MAG: glycosyltransferase, partial [Syntrophales bacterium]|nr:glycosyltransferase [Syntrophales bacterium]